MGSSSSRLTPDEQSECDRAVQSYRHKSVIQKYLKSQGIHTPPLSNSNRNNEEEPYNTNSVYPETRISVRSRRSGPLGRRGLRVSGGKRKTRRLKNKKRV